MNEKSEKILMSEFWVEQRDLINFSIEVGENSSGDQKVPGFIFLSSHSVSRALF